MHVPSAFRNKPCKFLQGNHCIKIGCKCVEKRFLSFDTCLIAEKEVIQRVPPPPAPPNRPQNEEFKERK